MEINQYQKLFDFIFDTVKLQEADVIKMTSKLSVDKYIKGDFILKQNQISKSLKFVLSGIYRVYQLNDGKEITSYFNYEQRNPLVASFVSLLTEKPSAEFIECIVPGKLISIAYSDWKELYKTSLELNTFGRLMAEKNYLYAIQRIESLQYQSASERYEIFLKLYPSLLNQIPHHYISSYLGITPNLSAVFVSPWLKSKSYHTSMQLLFIIRKFELWKRQT
ncbi:cyclic nucleotide-binding domain-containing protein [Lacinutrix neustonica]|uniref:Cyclic nucleotide-binding domain-containing protein n=1 Tax=Lacinutrix neustonica TaxID=2980107 RepID=A0A9E8MX24_9FLAO|nr:Crp/Fnr family transcriptional regulator [Lacinutrix neustonica]WAC02500.1 cyclic nucleotide-binding domain-containing protein [Lacinutrix neustonica]